jgi:hypothetical protein
LETPTVAAPAPTPVAEPSAPVAEKTLAQFRAERATPPAPVVEPPAAVVEPPPAPTSPLAAAPEPPEPIEEPETPDPAAVKPPEQGANHRWKDPETGIVLDMRRRDHRKMKRLAEERHQYAQEILALRQQLQARPVAPAAQEVSPPQQPSASIDPRDPEPTIEQFPIDNYANHPDPYASQLIALNRAVTQWEIRQANTQRADVERTQLVSAAIAAAQSSFDAELPSVRERFADFDAAYGELVDVLGRVPVAIRTPIVHRLLTAPQRHAIAYFLGNHPQELGRLIHARSTQEQQFVMGEIAAQVKAASAAPTPVPPQKLAPAPMAPVNSGGTPTTYNPATATLAQFRARNGVIGGRRVSA